MTGTPTTIRVLHVDDDPDFADLTATWLEREDERLAVRTATGPAEGLEILEAAGIDCIVSDYDMPRTNGIEFLEAVRRGHPDLPFILYTGKGSEEVASEAISAGVTDYLQKDGGTDQYTVLANRIVNTVERYRLEHEAEQTRAQLEAISESSADAILIIDTDSRIRFANPAVEALFGHDPGALRGESLTTLMPERYREAHRAALERYLETGERQVNWSGVEFTGQRRDGAEFPVSVSFGEFRHDGERRFVGIVRDISEQTRLEAELREREEQFRQLAENIQEVVWMADPEQDELLYVNPAYEAVWGRPVEELYGNGSFLDGVHPGDRDRVAAAVERQTSGGYDEEYRVVRPDGEQRWVWDRAVPVRNDDGEVYRIVGIVSDITDRREKTQRLETLISNLPGIVYRTRNEPDWPMEFVRGECEPLTGYTAAALERGDVLWGEDIMHPDDRDRVWEAVQEALAEERPFELTYRIRTADGDTRWVWERGRVVPASADEAILEGFITDITDRKRHELELERTNAVLSTLVETLPAGVLVEDGNRDVLAANRRLFELFDLPGTPADIVGTDCEQLAREASDMFAAPDRFVERIDELLAGREPEDEELDLADGRTFERTFRPVELPDGAGNLWMYRDVTDHRERERALRELKERFQAFVENSSDIITVLDADGVVQYESPSIERVLGYSQEELVGENAFEYVHPDDRADLLEQFADAQDQSDGTGIVEYRFRHADGSWVWLESAGRARFDSTVGGYVINSRDITGRKDREQRLEALNRATRELLAADTETEVAEVGIEVAQDVLDLEANAIHLYEEGAGMEPVAVSDAARELLGEVPTFTGGDSIAWRVYERGEARAVDDVHADSDRHNPGTPVRSELYLPIGEHGILIAGSSTPAAFDQQDLLLGEILAGNIATALEQVGQTERLRARERELTRQNERLEKFASVLSHDLRNPLNVATGRLELARDECESEHLPHVERAHERMGALIEDLLTLAREGEVVSDPEPVDLAALVADCWASVETRRATLVTDTSPTIQADANRLKQLFENLIRNAIEHGGEDVTVTLGELEGGFYIEDDGPGIPESDRDAVFEVGVSAGDAGTGFGLSIAREIAEAHGWDIRITEGDAGGARFEITGVEIVG